MDAARNASVEFFERQFRRQVEAGDYALNPFEAEALPHLHGRVLDLGCGLGNLALAAAARGAKVTALDASGRAIEDLARRCAAANLSIDARVADLREWSAREAQWDALACVGLLMFFAPQDARRVLREIRGAVRPGGVAVVNVLVEGTTYLDMFEPSGHCLFARGEVARAFPGWVTLAARDDTFDAPGGRVKRFETVIARRPES
jgi:tellurite methyltransferase